MSSLFGRFRHVLFLVVLIVLAASIAAAQSITGTVVDSTGASTKPKQYRGGGGGEGSFPIFDCAVSDKTETLIALPVILLADSRSAIVGIVQIESTKPRHKVEKQP